MSGEETVETDGQSGDEDGDGPRARSGDDDRAAGVLTDVNVWRYLRIGAILLLSMLALVATLQLYGNVLAAIVEWVEPPFVPVFQAAFNLVVLLLALGGLAVLARRRS